MDQMLQKNFTKTSGVAGGASAYVGEACEDEQEEESDDDGAVPCIFIQLLPTSVERYNEIEKYLLELASLMHLVIYVRCGVYFLLKKRRKENFLWEDTECRDIWEAKAIKDALCTCVAKKFYIAWLVLCQILDFGATRH